ncbi:MAG TPA: endonuclease/exonuclease/phosphatase family protein [Actinomycetota bacterium]|nr:endonuclease/exonuclease/phosphatase family protein [Actinomycetota bacterium]
MLSVRRTIVGLAVTVLALSAVPGGVVAKSDDRRDNNRTVRFATFNASLNRNSVGQLVQDLSTPNNPQAKTIAEIIQRNRPDVLLINEFDFDAEHEALRLFQDNYLSVKQNGARAINYKYAFTAPSNTGIPSGFDLNNDGSVGGPDDAFGFGFFPGQFGMAVYSRYPIDLDEIRTFQNFLWADMPGARLPDDLSTSAPNDWFSPEELEVVRLSSKSHWDVPIEIGRRTVHVLAAHPTPPVFDGPEDRNGLRNFDEIGFWADYVSPSRGNYIYDDNGETGGLDPGKPYIIMGDYNSDPNDGDSVPGAIQQILDLPGLRTDPAPSSPGGPEQAELQGGINDSHISDPAFDTADFADTAPGNLRVDYVLPSRPLNLVDAEVFWPLQRNRHFPLVGVFPFPSSDHRLVWAEVKVPGSGRR